MEKIYKKIDVIELLNLQSLLMHLIFDIRYTDDETQKSEYLKKIREVDRQIRELSMSSDFVK